MKRGTQDFALKEKGWRGKNLDRGRENADNGSVMKGVVRMRRFLCGFLCLCLLWTGLCFGAAAEDAEEMISYLNIVGGESDYLMHGTNGFRVPVEGVRRRIQASHESDNSVILIALDGGKIIARAELDGYAGARLRHNAKLSISVRKDYWNRKIGTALMTELMERAKNMNLRNIELEVIAGNTAAIALYHKMGFTELGTYRDYWFTNNAYSDAIIMQKCL